MGVLHWLWARPLHSLIRTEVRPTAARVGVAGPWIGFLTGVETAAITPVADEPGGPAAHPTGAPLTPPKATPSGEP